MKTQDGLIHIVESLLEKAARLRLKDAEVFTTKTKRLTIRSAKGAIESLSLTDEAGIGVRVMHDQSVGHSYTTLVDGWEALGVVEKAAANAREAEPDEANDLAGKHSFEPMDGLFDPALSGISNEIKISKLLNMEKTAIAEDKRVMGAETAAYSEADEIVALGNTRGNLGSFRTNGCYAYISLIATDGKDTEMGTGFLSSRSFQGLDFDKVQKEALESSTGLLGALQIETRRVPVILSPAVASEFIGLLAQASSGEAAQKGRSFFTDKLGQKVAADIVNIVDDARMVKELGSAPFDHEGTPTGRTKIVDKGILASYLLDVRAAKRMGRRSTGNGFRYSYTAPPQIAPTNFFIEAGIESPEDIIAKIKNGVYIQDIQGFHSGVNPVSGEFSVGASGWKIENGEKTIPFREVTIAGDIIMFMNNIVALGNDIRFLPMAGSIGAPTMQISELVVSGKQGD